MKVLGYLTVIRMICKILLGYWDIKTLDDYKYGTVDRF